MTDSIINVLLIEDNPLDARLVREYLSEVTGARVALECADCLSSGMERLRATPPDVLLLDLGLPESQGLDTLSRVLAEAPRTPVVVITGLDDEETAYQAVGKGAQDYLVKGRVDGELLLRGMRYAMERQRAEETLRESEERYRELVDNANDVVYTHDLEGNFTSANPAATSVYGYTAEEILHLNIADIVDPEYLPLAQRKIREKVDNSEQSASYELLTHTKDGKPIWVEVNTRLLQRERQPVEVLGIARDVTARKRAEQALHGLMDFNERIIQNMAEAIVVTDSQGEITFANPALAALLGHTVEELVGFPWTRIVPHDQHSIVEATDERRGRGQTDHYELELVRQDGQRVPVLVSGAPRFQAGQYAGTLGVFTDITERKRAEEQLRLSHDRLQEALNQTIMALSAAVETRDPYTAGHQRGVAELAVDIAQEMGLPKDQTSGIRIAGLVHDIGKIQIPAEILSKPTRLTEPEWSMVKAHPRTGYEILRTVEFPWPVSQIVLQHHERLDGSGYPDGLSDDDILLEARILAVADVVEAMASHRPYRPAHTLEETMEEIRSHKATLYDPEVVDACLRLHAEKRLRIG
jgi:PAS domain S-box-containing protein/putative nucleotidyltransferase with HDIG domain